MKFEVTSSETVIYITVVEANSEQEARDKIFNGDVELGEAEDSNGFQIDSVDKIEG